MLEGLIVVVVVVLIVGAGLYVKNNLTNTNSISNKSSSAPVVTANKTLTTNITSAITSEINSETSLSNGSDGQLQQNLTNANSATSNIGGSYNASNL